MNIVIFGPPGAGKGTQSKYIVTKYNLFQLSTGEYLRREIKKKTENTKALFWEKNKQTKKERDKKKLTDTYKKTDDMREAYVFELSQCPRRNRLCLYLNLLCVWYS